MKLCNFRPLCALALIVILAIGSAMVSVWLSVTVAVILFAALWRMKVPTQFKIVAVAVYATAIVSYVLTTYFVANPYYRTYDPDAGLRGVVLGYARWYLGIFLSAENANLVYAMLFGDKSFLGGELVSDFNLTGLSHVLTVSGLHIGLLFGVIGLILRWCRVPRRAHLWVVTPILIFYAYLCGWRYAVLRAVIMCLVYAIAKHRLCVADALSTLSLAAVVILIIYPYALVSASFLLSFSCVLGMILWYQSLYRVIPSKAAAVYLAVTLGSFPFFVYFFGVQPVLGLVADVVLLPLMVVAFYVGMFAVCTFVCGAVLWVVEPVLNFVRWITTAIGQLPWATVAVTNGLPAILIYLLASFVLSRFVFLRPKIKYPLSAALFTCYLILLVV